MPITHQFTNIIPLAGKFPSRQWMVSHLQRAGWYITKPGEWYCPAKKTYPRRIWSKPWTLDQAFKYEQAKQVVCIYRGNSKLYPTPNQKMDVLVSAASWKEYLITLEP